MNKRITLILIGLILSIAAVDFAMAAQYSRPNQTINADGWEDINGNTNLLHQSIDETTPNNGSDYIRSQTSGEKAELGLSAVSDPNTSSGHIMRIRVQPRDENEQEIRVTLNENSGNDRIARRTFLTSLQRSWVTFTFTLSASEANSITDYSDLDLEIENRDERDVELRVTWFEFEVPGAGAPPTVISPTSTAVTATNATLGGNVSNNGGLTVTDRGIEWGATSGVYNAPISSGSSGTGIFSQLVSGFTPGTTYYFRAWAQNSSGTAYSPEASFTTSPVVPTVTSGPATAVTSTTATLDGNVTSDGGTTVSSRGFEWRISPAGSWNQVPSGSGTGLFTHQITGLIPAGTYDFRAYASNSVGTGYSAVSSFTTNPPSVPSVDSPSTGAITDISAILGGNVASDGGTAVTERGIQWRELTDSYGAHLASGSNGTGVFIQSVGGLTAATTYFFRAYAINSVGIGYSVEASFTTQNGAPQLPVVTSPTFASVSGTAAILGGNITEDGFATINAHGIEWGLAQGGPYPSSVNFGSGAIGPFANAVNGFTPGSTVYFRAWASNSFGTAYSAESSFTTPNVFQASNIVIDVIAAKSMLFSWTPGSGSGSIVVMRLQATAESAPVDGTDYIAYSDYTQAPQTSTNAQNFVVYKGTDNSVKVSGLAQNVTYSISVYDWSGSAAQTDYLQANPAELDQATNGPAMHNYDNAMECGTCHSNHGNSGLVPRGANQEDVCRTCHNPLGAASNMIDFGLHGTPNHTTADDVDCGSCHELHQIRSGSANTTQSTHPLTAVNAYNLSFMRANVDKYIPTATADDAVNHTRGNDQAIEGGDAITSRGICQACHTGTDYHRNNSAVTVSQCHKGGSSDICDGSQVICTDCHTHTDGFEPSGGCIACHSSSQGGTPPNDRRAIVAEFNKVSAHIGFTSMLDEDCQVCHQQSSITPSHNHQDGFLTLWNVDDHAGAGYQLGDHTDPLTSATEAAKLNNFCLSCHDVNGAMAELTPSSPFTDAIAPVDIASNWSASSHATSPVSCLGDGAFGCHGSGHGGDKFNLLAPADTAATPLNFSEEEEGFCYNCHDGSPASTNIQTEFSKTSRHPVVNSEQVNGRTVECNDCHNPHEASASAGAPGASTSLRLANGPLTGVPGVNTAGNAVATASYEYEVCFRCHADSTGQPAAQITRQFPEMNKRIEFNGTKSSYHPVTTNNTGASNVPSLINGWTTSSITSCTNCHNSDSGPAAGGASPNGVHGSSWPNLLQGRYDMSDPSTYDVAKYDSCFACHSATNILNDNISSFGDHDKHIRGEDTACSVCHDPHASDKPRLINFDTSVVTPHSGTGLLQFNWNSPGNGSCTLRCHGQNHSNWSY